MLLLIPSLAFLINLFAKAIPNSDQITLASSNRNELLVPRQIIEASPSVACCDDCAERYEYNTFWDAFNNLCGWIGAEPMELWQSQIYYTQNYYCQPGSVTCMHMEIQYLCSDPLVYSVNYDGYMAKRRSNWYSVTLPTGLISLVLMLIITITALPVLRRKNYNTFYYAHLICSVIIIISASIHASTDFYFLLPGLILWIVDWAWRIFRGDTGVMKRVDGTLEDAGYGWYRISLPVSAKTLQSDDGVEEDIGTEKQTLAHPLQTYYLNFPSISKLQNHAFTAAKVGSSTTGPTFLFQRAQRSDKTNQKKLEREWTWKVGGQAIAVNGVQLERSRVLEVRVEGPYIPAETGYQHADRIVCVVGGTGLTGAYSLALWWLEYRARDPKAHFTFIWTVRHRETAKLPEWRQLAERAKVAGNMDVMVHASSENERLDVMRSLRDSFAATGDKKVGARSKAWVYLSGPAGLLSKAEDACVHLEAELRQAKKKQVDARLTVDEMEHYAAKW